MAGETSVTELAQPFAMSLPAVSKHLKVLEKAGLVSRGREAQWRPVKLDAGPLKDVTDWLEPYRRMCEERFDRLEAYLAELESAEAGAPAPPSPEDEPPTPPSPEATPADSAAPSPTPEDYDDGCYR